MLVAALESLEAFSSELVIRLVRLNEEEADEEPLMDFLMLRNDLDRLGVQGAPYDFFTRVGVASSGK